jgi:hypothetical protein
MIEKNEKEERDMGEVVEPHSSKPTHKRVKKPANRSLPGHARKRATDAEVALAVIAAGGRIGQAAEVLGKTSRAIRKRTGSTAAHKEMRGLPQKVRERFRKLVRDGMMAKLEEGDVVCACSLETGEIRDSITITGEPKMDDQPMEPGTYECWFVALDMHGNEYPSDVITYVVTEDGETIVGGERK